MAMATACRTALVHRRPTPPWCTFFYMLAQMGIGSVVRYCSMCAGAGRPSSSPARLTFFVMIVFYVLVGGMKNFLRF